MTIADKRLDHSKAVLHGQIGSHTESICCYKLGSVSPCCFNALSTVSTTRAFRNGFTSELAVRSNPVGCGHSFRTIFSGASGVTLSHHDTSLATRPESLKFANEQADCAANALDRIAVSMNEQRWLIQIHGNLFYCRSLLLGGIIAFRQ